MLDWVVGPGHSGAGTGQETVMNEREKERLMAAG